MIIKQCIYHYKVFTVPIIPNLHVTESKPKLNPDLLSGFTAGLLEWTNNKPKVNTVNAESKHRSEV